MKSPTKPKKPEFHPFFCHHKKCRKTAWDTPGYLSQSDRDLILQLQDVTSADVFADIVYELDLEPANRKLNDEAFFWRIIGWPEGRHYMRSLEYREWAFEKMVIPLIQKAATTL